MPKKTVQTPSANSDALVEQDPVTPLLGPDEVATFSSPVRVHVTHIRQRLADLDNLSIKAAIDGIVGCGVLATDSAEQVKEITHCQIKGSPEETIFVIEEHARDRDDDDNRPI